MHFYCRHHWYENFFCGLDLNDSKELCSNSSYDIFPTKIINVGSAFNLADSNCSMLIAYDDNYENISVPVGEIWANDIILPTQSSAGNK